MGSRIGFLASDDANQSLKRITSQNLWMGIQYASNKCNKCNPLLLSKCLMSPNWFLDRWFFFTFFSQSQLLFWWYQWTKYPLLSSPRIHKMYHISDLMVEMKTNVDTWRQFLGLQQQGSNNVWSFLVADPHRDKVTSFMHRNPPTNVCEVSQPQRRPALGPSPGWKRLLIRHYAKMVLLTVSRNEIGFQS